ncbi:glycosyltransferase family 2 protein [bacterium]|nr:glycosyltransferase family 2 protein [bacterium]
MLDRLLLILFDIIYIYFILYTAYFCTIVFASLKKRKAIAEDVQIKKNNLIVVVYAHNNEATVVSLLESLCKQDYPSSNYQIHIILDKCTDDSSNKLEIIGGAKIWRLQDSEPMGKDKAISWLLENLISFRNVDAFVFLDATSNITNTYLKSINEALQTDDVVVGSTNIVLENPTLKQTMYEKVNKFNNNVIKCGRARLSLCNPINSGNLAIKHDIIKTVQCIDFKDANSELKYSFLLTGSGFKPMFHNEIKTYVFSNDYVPKRATSGFKYSLILNCLKSKLLRNFYFTEFLVSLLKPNPVLFGILTIALLFFGIQYQFHIPPVMIIIPAVILLLAFTMSLLKSRLNFSSIGQIIMFPFYSIFSTIKELSFFKNIFTMKKEDESTRIEKLTVDVMVTNGKNNYPCTIDLVSESGFKKVIFRYGNKKRESKKECVRMCDAISNMSDILSKNGFRMKICQTCAYFTAKIDGSDNMIKGFCNKNIVADSSAEAEETVLWHSCESYLPQEVNNVVDISSYIKNRE